MKKPKHYFEVFVLNEASYRLGELNNHCKKYFESKSDAEVEFYDKVTYYSNEKCKLKERGDLSVEVLDSNDKWTYEVYVSKDVIKIW